MARGGMGRCPIARCSMARAGSLPLDGSPAGRLLASGPGATGGLTLASQGGPPAGLAWPPSGEGGRWDIAGIGVSSAKAVLGRIMSK